MVMVPNCMAFQMLKGPWGCGHNYSVDSMEAKGEILAGVWVPVGMKTGRYAHCT